MKNLLSNIGLSDGEGNISHTRLVNVAVAVAWLTSKFYNTHLTHQPITWDAMDLGIIGTIGGVSILKTSAENNTPPKP